MCVNMYYVMHMTGESQQLKFGETYAKAVKTRQSGLSSGFVSKPQKLKQLVSKAGTSDFSRLNILTRKYTPMI
jgi:hypothetical protein